MTDTPRTDAALSHNGSAYHDVVTRCERLIELCRSMERELYVRPRTEFVAVGWWDGQRALFEPGMGPTRGVLLFRPVSSCCGDQEKSGG